jgi:hypothetical protein
VARKSLTSAYAKCYLRSGNPSDGHGLQDNANMETAAQVFTTATCEAISPENIVLYSNRFDFNQCVAREVAASKILLETG